MEQRWLDAGHTDKDIDEAFTAKSGERPLLIPGGRDWYFDLSREQPHGPKAFRARLKAQADACDTILPMAATDRYYQYIDTVRREYVWRKHIHQISDHFQKGAEPRTAEIQAKLDWALEKVRIKYPAIDEKDVFVANWLMDTGACAELDALTKDENTSPLVNDHQIDGYNLLQEAILDQPNLKETVEKTHADRSPALEIFRDARREKVIIQHVAELFQANKLSWKEIRRVKQAVGGDIRTYYRLRFSYDEEDLQELQDRIKRQVFLIIATERLVKEVVSAGQLAASSRLPEFAQFGPALSEAKKGFVYKSDNNAISKATDYTPVVTEWALNNTVGTDGAVGKTVYETMRFAIWMIKMDERLTKLLLKPFFSISSISRVALQAAGTRTKVFDAQKPLLP
jgi:hypothetical protein